MSRSRGGVAGVTRALLRRLQPLRMARDCAPGGWGFPQEHGGYGLPSAKTLECPESPSAREIYKPEGKCSISTILCPWQGTGEQVPQVISFKKTHVQIKSQTKNENLEYNSTRRGGAPCKAPHVFSVLLASVTQHLDSAWQTVGTQ